MTLVLEPSGNNRVNALVDISLLEPHPKRGRVEPLGYNRPGRRANRDRAFVLTSTPLTLDKIPQRLIQVLRD